jgi:hypothetical protein
MDGWMDCYSVYLPFKEQGLIGRYSSEFINIKRSRAGRCRFPRKAEVDAVAINPDQATIRLVRITNTNLIIQLINDIIMFALDMQVQSKHILIE